MKPVLNKLPLNINLETTNIVKQLNRTSRALAELKGVAKTMPNQNVLINAIMINEAKTSSSIENIVTTHDEIYRAIVSPNKTTPEAKEVVDYRSAIWEGYNLIKESKLITKSTITKIQEKIEHNNAGFRKTPGTVIKNTTTDEIIYIPPQTYDEIIDYLNNLEIYINNFDDDIDPLIKLAIIHYQFESIHPFYDGNGRTGRILNILYLIYMDLLETPILYLSKYIINNKMEYYKLFQETRKTQNYENWILYLLKGIEQTSKETIQMINKISEEMLKMKKELKNNELTSKIYSKELLEALFYEFVTKSSYIKEKLDISERTALRYLDTLVKEGFLTSEKIGRERFYKNDRLFNIIKKFDDDKTINENNDIDIETVEK